MSFSNPPIIEGDPPSDGDAPIFDAATGTWRAGAGGGGGGGNPFDKVQLLRQDVAIPDYPDGPADSMTLAFLGPGFGEYLLAGLVHDDTGTVTGIVDLASSTDGITWTIGGIPPAITFAVTMGTSQYLAFPVEIRAVSSAPLGGPASGTVVMPPEVLPVASNVMVCEADQVAVTAPTAPLTANYTVTATLSVSNADGTEQLILTATAEFLAGTQPAPGNIDWSTATVVSQTGTDLSWAPGSSEYTGVTTAVVTSAAGGGVWTASLIGQVTQ